MRGVLETKKGSAREQGLPNLLAPKHSQSNVGSHRDIIRIS